MMPEKDAALATTNDFLRRYLTDLENGRVQSLSEYVRAHPGSDHLLPELWSVLHDQAGVPLTVAPTGDDLRRLSAAGRSLASAPDSIAELVDRTLADREAEAPADLVDGYRLVEEIGRGGQGRVYRARDLTLDREVAIKVLPTGASPEELRRLRREGLIAARLDDPCLCKAYDIGDCGRGTYVVMQFVPGETLSARIAAACEGHVVLAPATGEPPQDALLRFVARMGRTLDRMHQAGVLHRDIKPGNVMVADDGRPVILDLGLARTDEDMTLTRADTLLGTLDYMAPELLANTTDGHDPRSEVWSLGVVLFECLTARRPFQATTRAGLSEAILKAPLPPELLRKMSRDLRAVLETALDRDRDRRYATAGAFAEDLERLLRRQPVLARPIGPVLQARRAIQRRPAAAIALISAIVLPTIWALEAQVGERRATRYLGETLGTVESLLVQIAGVNLDDMPRGAALRRQLLEDAAARYRRLADDDRLGDDVDAGLARVEVELARLAMEQDQLDDALRYATRARERLGRLLARTPDEVALQDSAASAGLRYAAILIRKGNLEPALVGLEASNAELDARQPTPRVLALRIEARMELADAHRRNRQLDAARRALQEVLAITEAIGEPAQATAAVAWLCLAELHRAAGEFEHLDDALSASEVATQTVFRRTPSNRYAIGMLCLQQFYRADLRALEHEPAMVRANLARAQVLLSELGAAYPHWRQVDLMRWRYHEYDLRHSVAKESAMRLGEVVDGALRDVRAFDARLRSSRELLLAAAALMQSLVAALPEGDALARPRAEVETMSAELLREVARRCPDIAPQGLADDVAWQCIVRLGEPLRLGEVPDAEAAPPSSALARVVSTSLRHIGLHLAQDENRPEDALRQYETAHLIMEDAYARDPTSMTRRFLFYAMDRQARQLMLLGRWDEAIALREAGEAHFLLDAAQRSGEACLDHWVTYGPIRATEPLADAQTQVAPPVRARFGAVLARAVQSLDAGSRLSSQDLMTVRSQLVQRGREILDAALATGWRPPEPPAQDALLGVFYR
jgi:tetratricopeptide (TPR) repeat protein